MENHRLPESVFTSSPSSSWHSDLSLPNRIWSSVRNLLRMASSTSNDTCLLNCSGRGECQQGTCLCQVQYYGASCMDPNIAYFFSFALIFYLIALVSLGQLVICIRAEYRRMKTPSIKSACSVTTQKMLYIITFAAAALRGAYFSSPSNADLQLSSIFVSAYYPTILTASSLIVCFWAEAFHLRNLRLDRPRFLSKSFFGFLAFNAVIYSLFLADIILQTETQSQEQRSLLAHIFNGCYAVLLFIVLIFFLIYGVEVYFKVRGGFVRDSVIVSNVCSRLNPVQDPLLDVDDNSQLSEDMSKQSNSTQEYSEEKKLEDGENLLQSDQFDNMSGFTVQRGVDHSQLHQSRFGLVFQAFMFMAIVCFLCSDVLGQFWKNRVHLISRNAYDVLFRIVEIAVALWFPCCLWNCFSPEQLWILNPRKILKPIQIQQHESVGTCKSETTGECWICYDFETTTAGPMINPCDCKGDVGTVHHNCLRKWLMECTSTNSTENLACKVCGCPYQLERKKVWWIGKGLTLGQWLQTASLVTVMCGSIAGAWATIQLCEKTLIHALAVGFTLVVWNICLRCLGFNTFTAYQRAKISAVRILSGRFSSNRMEESDTSTVNPENDSVSA